MSDFVPSGYITVREALDCIGRELFTSEWTGQEHEARSDLITNEEWEQIPGVPILFGPGAGGVWKPERPHGDPRDQAFQAELKARKRFEASCEELRRRLEAGHIGSVRVDPRTGHVEGNSVATWRRDNALAMIKYAEVGAENLFVEQFGRESSSRPFSQSKIQKARELLQAEIMTKSTTRSMTEEQRWTFLRRTYPSQHITERQFRSICKGLTKIGRPRNADAKS
jgi:hypothetical protein